MNAELTSLAETAAVTLLAMSGVFLGKWFSRLRHPIWTIGYFIPLLLILVYGLATSHPQFSVKPPISWMMMGRNKFAVTGFFCGMLLTTPLSRIKPRRARIGIGVLIGLMVFNFSVWPFLAPAFNRHQLATIRTRFNSDDVCLQSTDYTCGPAAAVTALCRLGLPAEEGEIALLAHTSIATGTPADILARALQDRYAKDGLVAKFRVFKSLDELAQAGLSVVVIKYNFFMDHYVTVLEVTPEKVVVADPALGIVTLSRQEFVKKWRCIGVALSRPKQTTGGSI